MSRLVRHCLSVYGALRDPDHEGGPDTFAMDEERVSTDPDQTVTAKPKTVVLLCRGCCCGTLDKHPEVDHEGQRRLLENAVEQQPGMELRIIDCLDECDRSNVAVVRRVGMPARERDTWLGGLLTDRATEALAGWLSDGAEGPLPEVLEGRRFRYVPPRRRQRA